MTGADDPNLGILTFVAEALGELCDSVVFVGGCATGLLLTEQWIRAVRATQDVVAEVTSVAEYHELEAAVAAKGFQHDVSAQAPICRWVKEGIRLDLMPSERGVLSFHNIWYPLAVAAARPVVLPGGIRIRLISAPVFIGAKLEAFRGRGNDDYLASHDLEDILTVIDGRPELIGEIAEADDGLRAYIGQMLTDLLNRENFIYAIPGHLPGDLASQARATQGAGEAGNLVITPPGVTDRTFQPSSA